MKLEHSFEVSTDLENAWAVLLDVPRIAPCMPGTELTEVVGERDFRGRAKIKVGPVQLAFAGEAQVVEVDEAAHTAKVAAKGADTKGRGSAQADVAFSLAAVGDARTRVDVSTDLLLTGSVAQYGRAAGLIHEIANQIISDFVKNLESEIGADERETAPATAPKTGGDDAAAAPQAAAQAKPVSGLRLVLRALGAMIARWFRGRAAADGNK